MNFFTSDWHFWHKNVAIHCPNTRYGDTPDQIVDNILTNIFEQTRPGDTLYNTGDASFGTADQTWIALSKIRDMGIDHHLIFGNHDKKIRADQKMQTLFSSCSDKKLIKIGKKEIVLSHCPFAAGQWDSAHYGSYHFHGHTHGGFSQPGFRSFDVGIDARPTGDMKLWSFDELDEILKVIPVIRRHHVT